MEKKFRGGTNMTTYKKLDKKDANIVQEKINLMVCETRRAASIGIRNEIQKLNHTQNILEILYTK